MRGRHGYAILTQLGVTDTIARDKEEYVNIAVRLGQDRAWRAQIVERMNANRGLLFGDVRCVRALEDFFRSVVKERAGGRALVCPLPKDCNSYSYESGRYCCAHGKPFRNSQSLHRGSG